MLTARARVRASIDFSADLVGTFTFGAKPVVKNYIKTKMGQYANEYNHPGFSERPDDYGVNEAIADLTIDRIVPNPIPGFDSSNIIEASVNKYARKEAKRQLGPFKDIVVQRLDYWFSSSTITIPGESYHQNSNQYEMADGPLY